MGKFIPESNWDGDLDLKIDQIIFLIMILKLIKVIVSDLDLLEMILVFGSGIYLSNYDLDLTWNDLDL